MLISFTGTAVHGKAQFSTWEVPQSLESGGQISLLFQ